MRWYTELESIYNANPSSSLKNISGTDTKCWGDDFVYLWFNRKGFSNQRKAFLSSSRTRLWFLEHMARLIQTWRRCGAINMTRSAPKVSHPPVDYIGAIGKSFARQYCNKSTNILLWWPIRWHVQARCYFQGKDRSIGHQP